MRVSEHCFAVMGFEDLVNAGFVVGSRGIAVIDTTMFPYSAKTLLGYIRCLCPDRPIAAILNTHWHADHVFGNEVFRRAGAPIIAHRITATALANLPNYQKLCIERSGNLYTTALLAGVQVTVPEVCFDEDYRIDLGGVTVVARHLPGHTRSDIAIEVPEDGTVFAGDLVYNDMPPNLKFGNPGSWVRAMDSLLATCVEVVVPGHGSLCGRARLEELRAILTAAAGVVHELRGAGSCDEKSLAARLSLSEGSAHRLWGIARTGEEWPAWPYERDARLG